MISLPPLVAYLRRMLGLINDYDRDMIVLRMKRGRRLKASKGGYAYGSPAFGQRSVNTTLVKVTPWRPAPTPSNPPN